jgi:hypothetical protein
MDGQLGFDPQQGQTICLLKMAVFWVVAPCSLIEVYLLPGKLLPDYTVLQPRRQPSSYSPPWDPQILLDLSSSFCVQTSSVAHPASYPMGTRGELQLSWGITLTTHPHLVLRSRMSRTCNSPPPKCLHDV